MASLIAPFASMHTGSRPKLHITLRDDPGQHYDHRGVPIFSTLDDIRGEVNVCTESDMPFEQLQIYLTGKSEC